MNRTDAPVKQSTPFAVNGQREPILPNTPAGDNTASYLDGFPPITMTLKSAGGLPPKGQDMNQILFELSALARWASSGATNNWDTAFSTAIGGYPMGAVVLGTDGLTQYKSTVDSNTTNPNTGGAGWFNLTAGYLKTASNLGEIAAAGSAAVAVAIANLGLTDTVSQAAVALNRTRNLADLNDIPASRGSLGLKGAALLNVGTTSGTVAAGDDSRITGAMQKSANGTDIPDKAAFRSSIQLGSSAQYDVGTSAEVIAGTASKVVTIPALTALFDLVATSVNGSIRIPNRPGGIVIAWGTAPPGGDGTFTVAFNNPPFVMPQVASGQGAGAWDPSHVVVQNTTNTGFSTYTQSLARKYIAIGK